MSESPGGAFIDQFKNWSIHLFLFRHPRGEKEMHANPLRRAMKNRLFQKKQAVFGIPGPSYRDGAIQKVHKKCTAMLLKALKTTLGKGCFMASVQENRKNGVVVSYRFVACLGRDAHGKQIRRFKTWTPPKGIGPARAPKEAEKQK